jgi:transposase
MTPTYQLFVGVDIAYRTFTAATLTAGARPKREPKAYAQTTQDFERFQKRLREHGIEPAAILVVIEATGSYWVALATCLYHAGFAVSIINPAQAHYFAKAQLRQAKNDALDAEMLAQLAQALLPGRWTPPPQISHELHQRLAQRANLLELRTQVGNQLHALSVSCVLIPAVQKRLAQLIETITQQLTEVETELLDLVKIEEPQQEATRQAGRPSTDEVTGKWKASIARLLTIPGIGWVTACWLVVTTLNFTLCETAEAAVHFVGLAPMVYLSGTSVHARARISRCGHGRVRSQLSLATLSAARFHPIIQPSYDRLRAAGKPMKVARCACARKLLHIAFAVVTREQAFAPDYQAADKPSAEQARAAG